MIHTTIEAARPGEFTRDQLDALIEGNGWTLTQYLQWLGREDKWKTEQGWWIGSLTLDLAHWAEVGITTARELGEYLDACVEKEMRDEW